MRPCTNLRLKRLMIKAALFFLRRRAISETDSSLWDLVVKMSKTMSFSSSMRRQCSNSNHKRRKKREISKLVLPIATRTAATQSIIHQTLRNPKVALMTRNRSRFSKTIWLNPAWAKMFLPCNTILIICQAMFSEWPPRSTNLRNQMTGQIWEPRSLATQTMSIRIPSADPMSLRELKTTIPTSELVDSKRAPTMPSTINLSQNKKYLDLIPT